MIRRTPLAVTLSIILTTASGAGQAQTAASATDASGVTEMDKVSVTGSRIARSQSEGPSPVTVITGQELEKQGFTTVRDALVTINQSTGDVSTDMDQTGGTPNGQFVNLRGIGPGYTLVLLNGKRMANYPQAYDFRSTAVNLASIPAGAVARIEILSGGASAIYGSDAVAGVINIITKSDYQGDQFRVRAGTSTEGGGDTGVFQWSGGKAGDNWSVTYALEYMAREAVRASQRDFMRDEYQNPAYRGNPDAATAQQGVFLNNVGNAYLWPDANGALTASPDALAGACAGADPRYTPFRSSAAATAADRCGVFDYVSRYSIQNAVSQVSGLISGNLDFGDSAQAYFNLMASESKNKSYNKTMFNWYMSNNVYDPAIGEVSAGRKLTPEQTGGQAPAEYKERALSVNVGMRGQMFSGRFDWDASLSHSRYDLSIDRRFFVTQRINDYFLGPLLGHTSDGMEIRSVQVGRLFGPMDAQTFNDLSTVFTNKGDSNISNAQFVMNGDLFDLPAGTVKMAAVLEAGREAFNLDPDIRTRPDHAGGENIFNWTAITGGGTRNRYAVGLEFGVPLLSTLDASMAGRYDRYDDQSDVGGAFTWQAGLEWRPVSSLLLRATHATSFRAPDMTFLYSGESSNFYWLTDIYRCRVDGLHPSDPLCTSGSSDYYNQVQGTYSGNRKLQEETGTSNTVGLVWDVARNLSFSADWYDIKLEGAVSDLDSDFLMDQYANCLLGTTVGGQPVDGGSPSCQFYTGLVARDPGTGNITRYASYPVNQSMMRTQGVDTALRWGLDAGGLGNFDLRLGYTIVTKLESQLFAGDALINERDDLRYRNFRSKANWQVNWNRDDWQATVYGYRWGSLPNFANTGRIAPYVIWNAGIAKKILPQATLGLNVNNVFNTFHPRDDSYTNYPYFYRSYSPLGRQIYAELTYDF